MLRKFPRPIRRLVVKIGSSLIANYQLRPRRAQLRSLAEQINDLRQQGTEVILVSSGAIVLGMGEMGLKRRPNEVASLQALAAIGQAVLMRTYSDLFKKHRLRAAQILLTWDDFASRERYNNARRTLTALLAQKVVPVINENDTISTEEIKFGDNDKLSALVAILVDADLLLILSDVEGLYDPQTADKKIFEEVKEITREIEGVAGGASNKHLSRGGMSAKLAAVKMVTQGKIPCVIASGHSSDVVKRVVSGERVGTLFLEQEERLLARQHWIAFGAKPKGKIVVDNGAREALLLGGKSLLLPGIKNWEGHFQRGEVVVINGSDGAEFARGVIRYSALELYDYFKAEKAETRRGKKEVIHRNDLVLGKR